MLRCSGSDSALHAETAMAKLSTHILDTMSGKPAGGVRVELWRIADPAPVLVADYRTNKDGRTDKLLMGPDSFKPGRYELRFHIGAYFRDLGVALPDPAFLDIVPIPVGLAEADGNYHVPLLVSPWSYSTYRGS
jgi:5-hydroxyisourate hydrolase